MEDLEDPGSHLIVRLCSPQFRSMMPSHVVFFLVVACVVLLLAGRCLALFPGPRNIALPFSSWTRSGIVPACDRDQSKQSRWIAIASQGSGQARGSRQAAHPVYDPAIIFCSIPNTLSTKQWDCWNSAESRPQGVSLNLPWSAPPIPSLAMALFAMYHGHAKNLCRCTN